MRVIEY